MDMERRKRVKYLQNGLHWGDFSINKNIYRVCTKVSKINNEKRQYLPIFLLFKKSVLKNGFGKIAW